jgi:hypothetical protein
MAEYAARATVPQKLRLWFLRQADERPGFGVHKPSQRQHKNLLVRLLL